MAASLPTAPFKLQAPLLSINSALLQTSYRHWLAETVFTIFLFVSEWKWSMWVCVFVCVWARETEIEWAEGRTCISSCWTTCIWTRHWAVLRSSRACSLFKCLEETGSTRGSAFNHIWEITWYLQIKSIKIKLPLVSIQWQSLSHTKPTEYLLHQPTGPEWWSNKTKLFHFYLNWVLSCFSTTEINHNLGSLFCLVKDVAAVFCVCILHWCSVNRDPRQPPGYELMCYHTEPYLKTFC